MPSAPATATYAFGFSALALGVLFLIRPALSPALQHVGPICQDATEPWLRGNAVAAMAMGVYYPLLAYQENRAFFIATVPVRMFSSAIFMQGGPGWWEAGAWEAAGAVATAAALVWEVATGKGGQAATVRAKGSKMKR